MGHSFNDVNARVTRIHTSVSELADQVTELSASLTTLRNDFTHLINFHLLPLQSQTLPACSCYATINPYLDDLLVSSNRFLPRRRFSVFFHHPQSQEVIGQRHSSSSSSPLSSRSAQSYFPAPIPSSEMSSFLEASESEVRSEGSSEESGGEIWDSANEGRVDEGGA